MYKERGSQEAGYREVENRLNNLLDENPRFAPAAMFLVERSIEQGQYSDRTLDLAKRGVRFLGSPKATDLLAVVYLARGDYEDAANLMRWEISNGQRRGRTFYQLGQALALMGDAEGARNALIEAIEIGEFDRLEAARLKLEELGVPVKVKES